MSSTHITAQRYGAPTPPRTVQIATDDGNSVTLHVLREPAAAGALPVVFMHALAMDGNMWQGVADLLAAQVATPLGGLYGLDCRGHGQSGKPVGPYTTPRFAQDLLNVLDALEASRAHVVGCSMGGTIAVAFAGRHPDRVASLSVIDATAWYGAEAPKNWEGRAQTALQKGMGALIEFQRDRWFSPAFLEAQPALVQQAVEVFLKNDVPAYAESCRMLGHADERAVLAAYTGPAAVIVGEHDYATPVAMAQSMADGLAQARLTVIPDTRHYTPLEAPAAVAAGIAQAIAQAR